VRLKLLADEHVHPEVVKALRRRFPGLDAISIYDTEWRGLQDAALLEILDTEKRTLLTRDVNSVPRHANARLAVGLTHGGVLYVDSKRHRQADVRGLIRRLTEVVRRHGEEDWTCRSGWI
jgi:hypothetical protein